MKNKQLIQELRRETNAILPNVQDSVKEQIQFGQSSATVTSKAKSSKKLRFAWLAPLCALVMVLMIALPSVYLAPHKTAPESDTILAFSVNPKFEYTVKDNIITNVSALNKDAVVLFTKLNVVGDTVEVGIDKTLKALQTKGYLVDKTVNLLVVNNNQEFEQSCKDDINNALLKAQGAIPFKYNIIDNTALAKQAKHNGVSNNKMYLATVACEKNAKLTIDDALKLANSELNKIINDYTDDIKQFEDSYKASIEKLDKSYNDLIKAEETKKDDAESLIEIVEDKDDYSIELKAFTTKYPEFKYLPNADITPSENKEKLISELEKFISNIENEIEKIEKKYEASLEKIETTVEEKLDNDEDIDFDNDLDTDIDDDEEEPDEPDAPNEDKDNSGEPNDPNESPDPVEPQEPTEPDDNEEVEDPNNLRP